MNPANTFRVAVLVATAHRSDLTNRCRAAPTATCASASRSFPASATAPPLTRRCAISRAGRGLGCPPGGHRRALPDSTASFASTAPHDRTRTCTVPHACPAAVRVGGIADRAARRASCTTCLARTGASTLRSFPGSAPADRGDDRRHRSAGRGARPAGRSSRPCRRPRTVGSGCPGAREWPRANGR